MSDGGRNPKKSSLKHTTAYCFVRLINSINANSINELHTS